MYLLARDPESCLYWLLPAAAPEWQDGIRRVAWVDDVAVDIAAGLQRLRTTAFAVVGGAPSCLGAADYCQARCCQRSWIVWNTKESTEERSW